MPPLVRSASLTGYATLARALGLDPSAMLNAVGLRPITLVEPDLRIPADSVRRLLEMSAVAGNTEAFGLLLSEQRELSHLGPIALLLRQEPTVRAALDTFGRYLRIHNESFATRVEVLGQRTRLQPSFLMDAARPARQWMELAVGTLFRVLRALLGSSWLPLAVSFRHSPPSDTRDHRRIFNVRVEFSADFNGVEFSSHDLDREILSSDSTLAFYARQYLESITPIGHDEIERRVRETVQILLSTGQCTNSDVAQHLGVNSRTLHRRLAANRLTFGSVLAKVRSELAVQYLSDRRRSLADVSDILGFSAQSTFSRWFRSRFGVSPSHWRPD